MRTPEDLRDELLSSYRMSEAEKITKNKRELTLEEIEILRMQCQELIDKCK